MAGVHEALYAMLTDPAYAANAALRALVTGADGVPRVYPGQAHQGDAFPYLTFFEVSRIPESCMGSDSGHVESRVQVDAWGADASGVSGMDSARAVADAADAAIRRETGTFGGVAVTGVFLDNRADRERASASEADGVRLDYFVQFQEAA